MQNHVNIYRDHCTDLLVRVPICYIYYLIEMALYHFNHWWPPFNRLSCAASYVCTDLQPLYEWHC